MEGELSKYFEDKKKSIENWLKGEFEDDHVSAKLHEAMGYSLFSDCKRFRPVLAIASCEALGGTEESVLPFACAIEMIHTYSLIHDDLPAMDNDDLRRGKPTNHKAFGEAYAILAGDSLLTRAFEVASRPVESLSIENQLKIMHAIASASGGNGMVGGQALDIDAEGKKLRLQELENIHLHKTGKLIQCATVCGSLAANGSVGDRKKLSEYGDKIGLAFQISDDILDFLGKVPGKNPKGDVKNNKSTFATLLGVEESKRLLCKATEEALISIDFLGNKGTILKSLAVFIKDRIS